LAAIAHYCYASPDLVIRCLVELQKRAALDAKAVELYLAEMR
jgi:hypothetical protein